METKNPTDNTPNPSNKMAPKKSLKRGILTILINIGIMNLVGIGLAWGTLQWLKTYTRRNAVIAVPNIVGKRLPEADQILKNEELVLSVTDSVYNEDGTPGAIIDTTPSVGSMIKKGRTIFVTINAFNVRKRTVPAVKDVSMRQALALLKAIGFSQVTVKYVGGTYNDLVLGLKTTDGQPVEPGELLPYNTNLVLEVSANDPKLMTEDKTLNVEIPRLDPTSPSSDATPDENWF